MPREHEMYRPILEDVLAYSEGKRLLNISQVAAYVGHKREWVTEHLGVTSEGITAMALAHKLAREYSGEEVRT